MLIQKKLFGVIWYSFQNQKKRQGEKNRLKFEAQMQNPMSKSYPRKSGLTRGGDEIKLQNCQYRKNKKIENIYVITKKIETILNICTEVHVHTKKL